MVSPIRLPKYAFSSPNPDASISYAIESRPIRRRVSPCHRPVPPFGRARRSFASESRRVSLRATATRADLRSAAQINYRRLGPLLLLIPIVYLLSLGRVSQDRIPFHYPLPAPTTDSSFSPSPGHQIPPYVHFVFGLSPSFGGKPFGFLQYLCLSSALEVLQPEVIFMHHVYAPTGWWWDQFVRRVERKKGATTTELRMVRERDVTSVFGREVEHFAHKADVIRLEALRDYGGVYLDTDVMVIKGEHSRSALGHAAIA